MARTNAARIAGFALLFYIAAGLTSMAGVLHGPSARAAVYAQNASALVLALTLFVVTRVEQPAVAAVGMFFRLAEGLLVPVLRLAGVSVPHPPLVGATLFAIGSTLFCALLLSGRMIPRPLAWTGVIASVVLVAGLPLQLAGRLHAPLTTLMWMPMLAFEVPAGLWLLLKGVPPGPAPGAAKPARR